jgi:hypothetical protein
MKNTLPEIDRYIDAAPEYARPILKRIRKAFHDADATITEAVKWGHPFFEREGILGGMSAHKAHVRWGCWAGDNWGKAATVDDLPPHAEMVASIREAIGKRAAGATRTARPRKPAAEAEVPDDLAAALKKNGAAAKTFQAFPPSHRREYIQWITEAKQPATREKRLAQTLEWLAEGKPRNWKYMKK